MAKKYSLSDNISSFVFPETLLSYANEKVSNQRVEALKKGQIAPEAKLDLQGLKLEEARKALCQFIEINTQKHERCLQIVHGNGGKTGKPPLIKNLVNLWLPQFKEVLAFTSVQTEQADSGSVFVLLKKEALSDMPTRLPTTEREGSYLVAETKSMERKRRLAEQQGERQLGPVKAREHSEEVVNDGPEGELQNSILQHPDLDSQRFDGIDPNLNPEPPLNSEARREFDNEKREQEMEKQLRLGNMPKFSTAPTPRGP
jgi:DNA-nicking Smr family endonuclease